MKLAVGLIETVGLTAAIEAADTALKTANVELVGYELSKGFGFVTVKIRGDVSAVQAAIKAACISAEKVNKVFSRTILSKPHDELDRIIETKDTVGIFGSEENIIEYKESEDISKKEVVEDINEKVKPTCNLCMDSKCNRKKRESRDTCIHYNEIKK